MLFVFKQKTAYEMRMSDWSSDVCSSDLAANELIGIVEQNRIIDPRIGIFQDAISSATHDLREAKAKSTCQRCCRYCPMTIRMEASRSEERCVGKEWGSKCCARWLTYH